MNEKTLDKQKKEIFVSSLKNKDEVSNPFFIKYMMLNQSRDGRDYLSVVFSDKTGDIEGRLWSNAGTAIKTLDKGDFALVTGKVNLYQGKKQLIIQDMKRLRLEEIIEDDYSATSNRPPHEMLDVLEGIVKNLEDFYLRELLSLILQDTEIRKRLLIWPAGKTIHHAYRSGLLEHILSCVELSIFLSEHYQCNTSYVVAGAIIHDLGKIYELSSGLNCEYTEEGKLVGHLVKGVELIDRFSYKIPNFPHQMKSHLKHIIVSHHGHYEFGSPKLPQTTEAYLVHLIDYLDSKLSALDTLKKNDSTPGNWTAYNKNLERIIFKRPLPTFTAPISTEYSKNFKESKKENKSFQPQQEREKPPKELKQNLGKLFSDLSIKKEGL